MLQNSIYSVISPEGCATILWRDPKKTLEASKAMKLSSRDLLELQIIDEIIPEPNGGAHRDRDLILDNVRNSIKKNLDYFLGMSKDEILIQRKNKFLSIGRTGGFTTKSEGTDDLIMKEHIFAKYLKLYNKNKKISYTISLVIFIIIVLAMFI